MCVINIISLNPSSATSQKTYKIWDPVRGLAQTQDSNLGPWGSQAQSFSPHHLFDDTLDPPSPPNTLWQPAGPGLLKDAVSCTAPTVYFGVVSPFTPKGTIRNGTSRPRDRWRVRRLRSRRAKLSPEGHWSALRVPRGGRDLFPSRSCQTLPVRGLGVPGLVSGRQLAIAPNGTSCLELSTPPSAGLSPSSPRIPCLGLTTITEQRV